MTDLKILASAVLYVLSHALSLVLKPVCVVAEKLSLYSQTKLAELQKPKRCEHKIVVEDVQDF